MGDAALRQADRTGRPALRRWREAEVSPRLQAEVVATLFRNVAWAVLGAGAGAVGLAFSLARLGLVPQDRAAGWAGFIVAGAAAHLLLRWAYYRSPGRDRALDAWAGAFTAICLAEGLGWGYAALLLVPDGHFDGLMLAVATSLAIAGGSVPAFSAHLPALAAFMLPVMVPYAAFSAVSGEPLQRASAPLMALYILGVGGLGVMANRSLRELVALRIRTSDLAEGLREQKEIAEQASLAKSSFLAAASHDLRQPVHALGLFVGALRGIELPPEGLELVEQIEASTAAMDTLFGALLDISRLDAGVVEARPRPFAIQPLLARICREFEAEAQDKGLSLVHHPCGAVIDTDPVLLERILRNLVSNAVRYTSSGRVVVGCRRRGRALGVEVWDTGPGIPADMRQRVFQEYFQLANPERDRSKGLGLGLAIVRRLAELIQGELVLRSEAGRGSCFAVSIPRAAADAALETADASEAAAGALARRLVVVIDDELAIREAMTALLAGWGHEVVAAGSAAEALERLADCPVRPDVIVCDYRLRDGETGIAAIEALRSEYNAVLPAMLITGDTAPDRLAEAQSSGLLLLHKPVPNGRLRAAIANLVLAPPAGEEDEPAPGSNH